ncbi:hypothetical protein [Paraliomyxa miuraensis]|uniref:hypothetical protein n=1 Tax=Paraliomyxa miuraensis TaxID=376150 RepID=UPI00225A2BD5|nr:hypothetical protein [Paraliomyxa miuraensis]MCX4246192.1 hypothetical protein [Paraliomyxa miuraensis]
MLVRGCVSPFVLALGLASVACSAEVPAGDAATQEARARAAAQAGQPTYTVDVDVPPTAFRGKESLARVRVQPRAPWHMNLEYPAKLQLRAPADVELVTPLLHKGDAERFDDQALEFSVVFTPNAKGARTIQAQLDFAVCGDAACGPVTESLELAFEVGCATEDTGLC